jgi:1-acyl-sn-glycerol-3-phosphate acyltransferase
MSFNVRRLLTITVYVLFFWLVLPAALIVSARFVDLRLHWQWTFSPLRPILGSLLTGGCAALMGLSLFQFRKYGGELPVSAFKPKRLIQQGLFAVWRHPIYLFFTLTFAGLALVIASPGLLFIVMPVFIIFEALYLAIEEWQLVHRFGQAYQAYRKRTPLVIPRLKYFIRLPFRLISRILFSYEILHRERIPEEPPFFVIAAHRNYLDPWFVDLAIGFPISFIATFEIFRTPLSRFIFHRFMAIPKRRYRNDIRAARTIVSRIREGYVIGVFPEAERSWTGKTASWKPEALDLFRRFPEIPILPVKLEGNYLSWPRWGKNIRRAKLRITIQQPISVGTVEASDRFEPLLRSLVEPDDNGIACRSRNRARDIAKVIYRCPACRTFAPLKTTGRSEFACPSCKIGFDILSDYHIRFPTGKTETIISIPELYERIRVFADDVKPASVPNRSEYQIAESGFAASYREQGYRMKRLFPGRLILTNRNLCFTNGALKIILPLDRVRSVTIESNYKLQVFDGQLAQLYQFTFEGESALKWQDFIVEAIRHGFNFTPNCR